MTWNGKDVSNDDMLERGFTVDGFKGVVPGVYWTPSSGNANQLVLLGHGGTTHKKVEYITAMALEFTRRGIAAMAIDGPGHGERSPKTSDATDVNNFAQIWEADGGHEGMIADWRAALDFIESVEGARPTGWWGLSMGTMMGLPVTATDNRIQAAFLGLMGTWGPNGDELLKLAPDVNCPVMFVMQWDDEIVPRDTCLALFDAIGTRAKTLHANPGKHTEVPLTETNGSIDFLEDILTKA